MGSEKCIVEGCERHQQKDKLCRSHFKEKFGMTVDEAKEREQQGPKEMPYADPETGKPMGNLKRVSEVYRYDNGTGSATITLTEGKVSSLEIEWVSGETWTLTGVDMPFLSGLVKEVEGLCRCLDSPLPRPKARERRSTRSGTRSPCSAKAWNGPR